MGAKSDEAKGRIKEAAGDLTGKVKGKVNEGVDKAKDIIGGKK